MVLPFLFRQVGNSGNVRGESEWMVVWQGERDACDVAEEEEWGIQRGFAERGGGGGGVMKSTQT